MILKGHLIFKRIKLFYPYYYYNSKFNVKNNLIFSRTFIQHFHQNKSSLIQLRPSKPTIFLLKRNFTTNDDLFNEAKDFYFLFCISIPIIGFCMQTFFSDKFLSKFILWKENGSELKLSKEMLELIYDATQSSHLDNTFKQIHPVAYHLSNNIEPIFFGNLHSRFGTLIVLPFYFNYENPEDIDEHQVAKLLNLNYEKLENDDNKSTIGQLKECLCLSKEAKKFVLLSLLHSSWTPISLYVDMISLAIFPYFSYRSVKKLKTRFNLPGGHFVNIAAIIFGFALYGTFMSYMRHLLYRFGYYSVFKYETNDEMATEQARKAAEEYLKKLQKLQMIVQKFSNNPMRNDEKPCPKRFTSISYYYPINERMDDLKHFQKLSDSGEMSFFNLIKN